MSSQPRIVVALTLSPVGEAKLPVIAEQARALNAEVIALHVLDARLAVSRGHVSPEEACARTYLDVVACHLHAAGVRALPLLRFGSVVPAICASAREHGAALIIAGASDREGVVRRLRGGLAASICRHAPCPVLIVQPPPHAEWRPPALRRFDDDARLAGPLTPQPVGTRTVEVARIVGAVTRTAELDRDFRPRRRRVDEEAYYVQVRQAMEQRPEQLAPVELYKLGYGYYVLSGHEQVAAARQLSQEWIEASVTEYLSLADPDARRVFAERAGFERATGLTRIGARRPGTYGYLEEQIRAYGEHAALADLKEAAMRWYAAIFRPVQLRIRALRLAEHFPGERSADLFVRVGRYLDGHPTGGRAVTWAEGLRDFSALLRRAGQEPAARAA